MQREMPPVIYVPCTGDTRSGDLHVALRPTKDGRTALLGYTALDRLRAGAGAVPWALLSVAQLQAIHDTSPYDVIYLDIRIPEAHRDVDG